MWRLDGRKRDDLLQGRAKRAETELKIVFLMRYLSRISIASIRADLL